LLHVVGDGTTITVTGNPATSTLTISSLVTSAETLTGNSGPPIAPVLGNINTIGTGSITISGAGNTLTTQLTGLTNHDVLVGAGTATITSVSPSTAGFVLTSNGVGADPSFQAASASGAITTITGNSGGAEVPLAGNFNIVGSGSITVAGSANTETVQLTGLTAHNILLGEGTATVGLVAPTANTGAVLQNNAGADPTYSTATYPSTTTINQLLYSSAANVVSGLATGNNGVLITNAMGVPSLLPDGTTGQFLTATTGSPPSWTTVAPGGVSSVTGTANQILASPTTGAVVLSLVGPYTPATYTAHGVLLGEGTSSIVAVAPNATSGLPLISQGSTSDPAFGTAVVAGGGTGAITLTSNGVLLGNGTSAVTATTAGTTGQVLTGVTGSAPTFQSPAASSISITGDSGGALSGAAFTLTGGTTGLTFAGSGSTETLGGTLVVANGGTGVATLTGLALGSGTSAFSGVTYVAATTFTPVLQFGGATTGITYTTQYGKYQRVGNCVTFDIYILLAGAGSASGAATITGLPVTSANDTGQYSYHLDFGNLSDSSASYFSANLSANSTTLSLNYFISATGVLAAVTNGFFGTGTVQIRIQGSYFV